MTHINNAYIYIYIYIYKYIVYTELYLYKCVYMCICIKSGSIKFIKYTCTHVFTHSLRTNRMRHKDSFQVEVWIQSFPLARSVAIPSLRSPVCPTI